MACCTWYFIFGLLQQLCQQHNLPDCCMMLCTPTLPCGNPKRGVWERPPGRQMIGVLHLFVPSHDTSAAVHRSCWYSQPKWRMNVWMLSFSYILRMYVCIIAHGFRWFGVSVWILDFGFGFGYHTYDMAVYYSTFFFLPTTNNNNGSTECKSAPLSRRGSTLDTRVFERTETLLFRVPRDFRTID